MFSASSGTDADLPDLLHTSPSPVHSDTWSPPYSPISTEWVIITQTQLFDILMQEGAVHFSHNFQGAEGEYLSPVHSYTLSPPYSPSSTEWVKITQTQLFNILIQEEYLLISFEEVRSNRRLYYTSMFQERLDQMTHRSLKLDYGWHMWQHYDRFKRLKMRHDSGSFSMSRTAMPVLYTDADMPDLVTNNTRNHN